MSLELTFHGAAGAVTGSCKELKAGERRILIDCGLFQGSRNLEALNHEPLPLSCRASRSASRTRITFSAPLRSKSAPRARACYSRGTLASTQDAVDPQAPEGGWDHVVCESTYGNRDRTRRSDDERRETLAAIVEPALTRGGDLLIPAFALERTQVVLGDLVALFASGISLNPDSFAPTLRRLAEVEQALDAQRT